MPKTVTGQWYSDHINRRVTQSIFRAFDFAFERKTPLNTYVVINLRERDEAAAATIFEAVRHKFRDWLNYATRTSIRGPQRPAYIYAIEHPEDVPHVNWALHVPPHLAQEFARKLPRWVERAQGSIGPYDVHCDPITFSHAKRLAKYIVKGTDPAFIDHFHLAEMHEQHGPQGRIWGKRAGVSPSLGKTARDAAGFKRRRRTYPAWTPRPANSGDRAALGLVVAIADTSWVGGSTTGP